MALKKKLKHLWWIIGIVIVIVAAFMVFGSSGPDIDYSQYSYTDSERENPDAAHVITEYSDFQCPFCAGVVPTLHAVETDFDVRLEFKHFPLPSIHSYSELAAEAAECARDQGRFWAYHDMLYEHQDYLAKPFLLDHAKGLGLDISSFKTCLDNREKQAVVTQDELEGESQGVTGTPTIFLDGQRMQQRSYEAFAALLG